jgi:dTDP-4-amino-4,6-dideoxygalactose transaminase
VTAVAVGPVPFHDRSDVHLGARDALTALWDQVLGHGRFVGGPEVGLFEVAFAEYCGASHCVGVGNGTDALELILVALGIGAGDEVICPANTFVATVEAICSAGARPRFVDVRPDTLLLDVDAVRAAIGPRTAAVIAVHLYGQMVDVDALERLTARHGLVLVEDAAQAHGARFRGRRAGGVGYAAAFSFYPGKNLGAVGDAGAVVTSQPALAARIRQLADHGRDVRDRYRHGLLGRNSRLDSLQAAVLSYKLERLDGENERRRRAIARYRSSLPVGITPLATAPGTEPVHHLAVVQVENRADVTAELTRASIGWGLHYPVPCHRQEPYAQFTDDLPVVEAAADRVLSLPLFPSITAFQIDSVCDVLHEVHR